jgi:hypothetical protein
MGKSRPACRPARYDLAGRSRSKRRLALTHEHRGGVPIIPLQAVPSAQFRPAQRMDGGHSVLTPGNLHPALCQIDLIPTQTHQFRYTQAVAIGDQDQGCIAQSVSALGTRRSDDPCDFLFRQILPAAVVGIGAPNGNFSVYDGWGSGATRPASPVWFLPGFPTLPFGDIIWKVCPTRI